MPHNLPWAFFICVFQSPLKKKKDNHYPHFIGKDHEMSFSVVPGTPTAQGTDPKHHEASSKFLLAMFLSVVTYYIVPIGDLFHWTTQCFNHSWAFISLFNSINNAVSLFSFSIDSLCWPGRVWVTFAYKPLWHVGSHRVHSCEIPLAIPAVGAGSVTAVPALCRQPSRVVWNAT